MATFQYQAVTPAGRLMKGAVEAGSQPEAAQMLEQMQLTVNALAQAEPESSATSVGRNEFLLFNQQLASITKAGIPLERGLRELSHDISSKKMRRLIDEVASDLESGTKIEEAFDRRQGQFPALYGRILKAGVESGRLSEMLTSLNRHLELASRTRRIIFEAMAYPAVVLLFAAVIVSCVFMFVIPQFKEVLHEMVGTELNPITTFVLASSANIIPFWLVLGCLVAALVLVFSSLSSSAAGRRTRESLVFKIPVIGNICRSGILGRFSEAMAIMVVSGTDIPTGLRLAAAATSCERLILETDLLAERVEQGVSVLEAGQSCRMMPRLVLYSIQLGIQRNELQDNLHNLGQMYSEQAIFSQSRLQSVLLPGMIVLLGGIIGLTVLAVFLPMIQVITSLSAT